MYHFYTIYITVLQSPCSSLPTPFGETQAETPRGGATMTSEQNHVTGDAESLHMFS